MTQMSFETSQRLWIGYMVSRISSNLVYGKTLGTPPVPSYLEFVAPDMYYIDGVNKVELPFIINGIEYKFNQIQTFNEWYNSI